VAQRYKKSGSIQTKTWDILPDCDLLIFVIDAVKTVDLLVRNSLKRLNGLGKLHSELLDLENF
jgi:hypothetical protein